MMFFYMIGFAIAAIPVAALVGWIIALAEHWDKQRTPHTERMRRKWAAVGCNWPKGIDPVLPPPTKEQACDLAFMENNHREHLIEMAVHRVAERASFLYVHCNHTIDGARSEAMRKEGAAITAIHGYDTTREVKRRVEDLPVALLLNQEAHDKLVRDTDALMAAHNEGGLSAQLQVAQDLGMGKDPTYAPFAWMEPEQEDLRRQLRGEGRKHTAYKRR